MLLLKLATLAAAASWDTIVALWRSNVIIFELNRASDCLKYSQNELSMMLHWNEKSCVVLKITYTEMQDVNLTLAKWIFVVR